MTNALPTGLSAIVPAGEGLASITPKPFGSVEPSSRSTTSSPVGSTHLPLMRTVPSWQSAGSITHSPVLVSSFVPSVQTATHALVAGSSIVPGPHAPTATHEFVGSSYVLPGPHRCALSPHAAMAAVARATRAIRMVFCYTLR